MSETLREALDWCLDYIEGTDVRNPTMPPLAEPFFSEQMARYRALVDETPKDDRASALLAPFAAMGGDWAMPAYHDLEDDIIVWGPSAGRSVTAGDVRAARRYLDGAPADEPDYRPALATPPAPAGDERDRRARFAANAILDRANADPDDDESIVARALLRHLDTQALAVALRPTQEEVR